MNSAERAERYRAVTIMRTLRPDAEKEREAESELDSFLRGFRHACEKGVAVIRDGAENYEPAKPAPTHCPECGVLDGQHDDTCSRYAEQAAAEGSAP